MSNKILFVSFLDFKEKSIQVIRKTPEFYLKKGWNVYYLVVSDRTIIDNYTYEKVINPLGIKVFRTYLPLSGIINFFDKKKLLKSVFQKISYTLGYIKAIRLALKNKLIEKDFDIVYGYEIHGINTLKILKLFGKYKKAKSVYRYQGSFMYDYIQNIKISKIISNFDHLIALKSKPDLSIMTNDGTNGDKLWDMINGNDPSFRFWPNGVDIPHN